MRFNKAFLIILFLMVAGIFAATYVLATASGSEQSTASADFNATLNIKKLLPSNDLKDVNVSSGVYYLNNGTYSINITIKYNNESINTNVSAINITLPNGFTFQENTNITESRNVTGETLWTSHDFANTSNVLMWNSSADCIYSCLLIHGNSTAWFAFNVTVAASAVNDSYLNLTITIKKNITHSPASILGAVYLDNTFPTLVSARTINRTTVNVTFSEAILNHSLRSYGNQFFITLYNDSRAGWEYSNNQSIRGDNTSHLFFQVAEVGAFPSNYTPIVSINVTDGGLNTTNITDLAGNKLVKPTIGLNVTASDGVKPSLLTAGNTYDANATIRNLTLIFDEPMSSNIYCEGIDLIDNSSNNNISLNTGNCTTKGGSILSFPAQNKTVITLSYGFASAINDWDIINGMNISFESGAFNDTSNNSVNPRSVRNGTGVAFIPDTTSPILLNATYVHSSKNLTLLFNEFVDLQKINLSHNLLLSNRQNISAQGNNSNGGFYITVNGSGASTVNTNILNDTSNGRASVYITLSDLQAYNISSWRVATIYVSAKNVTITDMAYNGMQNISNISATALVGYTNDTNETATPTSFIRYNTTYDALKYLKADDYINFNITFNEWMNTSLNATVSLTTPTGTALTGLTFHHMVWHNNTMLNATLNITNSITEGVANISITAAQDGGGNQMGANTSNQVTIDRTPPNLTMAWYNDTGGNYNVSTGRPGIGPADYLVLKFSENVSVRVNLDISRQENASNATNIIYLANGTGATNEFKGNDTTDHVAGINATFIRQGDFSKVRAYFNETMRIITRGQYNETGDVKGIIPVNGTAYITDLAGNVLSNSSGVLDIYDTVIELSQDTWTGFSIPYAINTTQLSRALSGTTNTVYTYNGTGSTFITATASELVPRRGYLIKVNQSTDMPIQTLRQQGADGVLSSITVSNSWVLLGIDNFQDNSAATNLEAAGQWLESVASYSDQVYDSMDLNTQILPGGAPTNDIRPYRSYWVFLSTQPAGHHNFLGYGNQ